MAVAFIVREIFTGHEILTGMAVLVREGKVLAVVPAADIPAGYRAVDLDGYILAPAFIDLQIYGGMANCFPPNLRWSPWRQPMSIACREVAPAS